MNFFVRFFVGYVIVTAVAVLLAMKLFTDQFVPGVRQSVEETLVQMRPCSSSWDLGNR